MSLESEFISKVNDLNSLNEGVTVKTHPKNRVPNGVKSEYQIIFSLIYNYKYEDNFVDLLVFDDELLESEEYYMFGKNLIHSLDYVIHKFSGEVLALDADGDVAFRCAKNCESFITAMIKVLSLELFYTQQMQVDDELKLSFQENCATLTGGDYYKSYYELII